MCQDSRHQVTATISESRKERQEESGLDGKRDLYTCPVVPSSLDLFPVSSTGAGSTADHTEK